MVDIKRVLEMRAKKASERGMERAHIVSRDTCQLIYKAADKLGIRWPLPPELQSLTKRELHDLMFPDSPKRANLYTQPNYEYVHRRLAQKGITLKSEWEKYCNETSDGKQKYGYTRFRTGYNDWTKSKNAIMRLQWKPGDTMMVDWAGLTLTYTTDGGVRKVLYFFVAVLPYSDLIFACACPDMKIPSWLNGHIRAFEYFGGVTGDVISDNLKAGVTKHAKYELILNESYREFGEHYNVHINPTGVRRPKEKASVERAVRHVTEQIIVKVRDMDLHSFDDINEAVSKLLDNVNSKILSDYNESRYSLYMREEYESMRPLPEVPFEIGTWKSVTVPADYHISVEKNKYSVPYTLIDERVSVRITEENVYVYHEGKLVALHTKAKSKCRNPVTTQAHMHPKHIAYQEKYDPEYIRAWADKEGGRIKQMVTDLLESGRSPKEGVKHCVSLMNLVERHSKEAVEAAYYEAVSAGDKPTLKVVAGIVKKKSAESMQGKNAVPKPSGYSRGAGYYK